MPPSVSTKVSVTIPMTEYVMSKLLLVFPEALNVSGDLIKMGEKPGQSMLGLAARLVVTPVDGSAPTIIHQAFCENVSEYSFDPSEQTTFEALFVGLTDLSRTDGDTIVQIGDSTAT